MVVLAPLPARRWPICRFERSLNLSVWVWICLRTCFALSIDPPWLLLQLSIRLQGLVLPGRQILSRLVQVQMAQEMQGLWLATSMTPVGILKTWITRVPLA